MVLGVSLLMTVTVHLFRTTVDTSSSDVCKRERERERERVLCDLQTCWVSKYGLSTVVLNKDSSIMLCMLTLQLWLSGLTFSYGFLMDGAIAVIGLCSMEVVPKPLAGSAHGLACALAQSKYYTVTLSS